MGFTFTKDGNENIGAADFFSAGRLYMLNSSLEHTLKAQCGLSLTLVIVTETRRIILDKTRKFAMQFLHIGAAGPQHLDGGRVVQQCQ